MIPYCQHQVARADCEAVTEVLRSPRLTQGPVLGRFEEALCRRTDSSHAVALSSGTSALQVALTALGVAPGDEVIVPSLTFLASANAVLLCGATPVFADVDPNTLALDPHSLASRITPRTRGAILVHYAGHVGDVAGCRAALGDDRFLLEDACHALGAEVDGRAVGGGADAACFSFHPAKHITTGEGGAITTGSQDLARRCRQLREHGMERDADHFSGLGLPEALTPEGEGGWVYEMQALAGNHRLSDAAAALGLSQLSRLDEILEARRKIAARYDEAFANEDRVIRLEEPLGTRSAWHLYPIRLAVDRIVGGRAAVYRALHADGVAVQVHYIPIHLQPYYRERFGTRYGDLPHTEAAYLSLLSLPLYPGLSALDQEYVIAALGRALDARAR